MKLLQPIGGEMVWDTSSGLLPHQHNQDVSHKKKWIATLQVSFGLSSICKFKADNT